jgi:hypothetical protein
MTDELAPACAAQSAGAKAAIAGNTSISNTSNEIKKRAVAMLILPS